MAGRASGIKMGDDGGGLLISPDGVVPAHPHRAGKRAVKWLCVCVCVLLVKHFTSGYYFIENRNSTG